MRLSRQKIKRIRGQKNQSQKKRVKRRNLRRAGKISPKNRNRNIRYATLKRHRRRGLKGGELEDPMLPTGKSKSWRAAPKGFGERLREKLPSFSLPKFPKRGAVSGSPADAETEQPAALDPPAALDAPAVTDVPERVDSPPAGSNVAASEPIDPFSQEAWGRWGEEAAATTQRLREGSPLSEPSASPPPPALRSEPSSEVVAAPTPAVAPIQTMPAPASTSPVFAGPSSEATGAAPSWMTDLGKMEQHRQSTESLGLPAAPIQQLETDAPASSSNPPQTTPSRGTVKKAEEKKEGLGSRLSRKVRGFGERFTKTKELSSEQEQSLFDDFQSKLTKATTNLQGRSEQIQGIESGNLPPKRKLSELKKIQQVVSRSKSQVTSALSKLRSKIKSEQLQGKLGELQGLFDEQVSHMTTTIQTARDKVTEAAAATQTVAPKSTAGSAADPFGLHTSSPSTAQVESATAGQPARAGLAADPFGVHTSPSSATGVGVDTAETTWGSQADEQQRAATVAHELDTGAQQTAESHEQAAASQEQTTPTPKKPKSKTFLQSLGFKGSKPASPSRSHSETTSAASESEHADFGNVKDILMNIEGTLEQLKKDVERNSQARKGSLGESPIGGISTSLTTGEEDNFNTVNIKLRYPADAQATATAVNRTTAQRALANITAAISPEGRSGSGDATVAPVITVGTEKSGETATRSQVVEAAQELREESGEMSSPPQSSEGARSAAETATLASQSPEL